MELICRGEGHAMFYVKAEQKKFSRNCQLTSYAIIFSQRSFFSIIELIFQKNVSFTYSIITLFSKNAYYLNRLSRELKLTSLYSKNIPYFL